MAGSTITGWDDVTNMVWETQMIQYHGVGALSFLLWDTMITLGDEVQYIWPQNRRSPTKWVFLFTRYFGLLAQARLATIYLQLIPGSFSADICRMLYVSQVVFGGILLACIQSLLMLRVYALYTQDNRVALTMISLLVAEIGSMPGIIHLTMPVPTTIGNMCMKPITIRDIALFGVSAILPQIIVLGLTVGKFLAGLRAGWGKIPIVSRLVRDDLILVSVIVVWVVITASLTRTSSAYGYAGYTWLLSLVPSIGCRVVINMQRIFDEDIPTRQRCGGAGRPQPAESAIQFTSIIIDTLNSTSLYTAGDDVNSVASLSLTHSSNSDPVRVVQTETRTRSHYHVDSAFANTRTPHAQSPSPYASWPTIKSA